MKPAEWTGALQTFLQLSAGWLMLGQRERAEPVLSEGLRVLLEPVTATSQVKDYPFEVPLPPGGRISGVVLADHVKNLDWQARRVVFEAKAPAEILTDVRERLRVLLGL